MGIQDRPDSYITTFSNLAIGGGIDAKSGPDLPELIAYSLARFCTQNPEELEVTLHRMLDELMSLREQKKTALEDSVTDSLTGAHNRRFFEKFMQDIGNSSVTSKREPSGRHFLLLIDLDQFKPLNDKYGHAAGDLALQCLSGTLRAMVRKSDIVCRIGGDEFAIVLKDATEKGAHRKIAQIANTLRHMEFEYEGAPISFAGSVGHTEINPSAIRTMEDILREADRNLYKDKERKSSMSPSQESPLEARRPEPAP